MPALRRKILSHPGHDLTSLSLPLSLPLMFNFDQAPQRQGTGSLKWDKRPGLQPYWVADMDFPSPPEVLKALHDRVDHGVFGYAVPHQSLIDAILEHLANPSEIMGLYSLFWQIQLPKGSAECHILVYWCAYTWYYFALVHFFPQRPIEKFRVITAS